jgi:hypothetical protein
MTWSALALANFTGILLWGDPIVPAHSLLLSILTILECCGGRDDLQLHSPNPL